MLCSIGYRGDGGKQLPPTSWGLTKKEKKNIYIFFLRHGPFGSVLLYLGPSLSLSVARAR